MTLALIGALYGLAAFIFLGAVVIWCRNVQRMLDGPIYRCLFVACARRSERRSPLLGTVSGLAGVSVWAFATTGAVINSEVVNAQLAFAPIITVPLVLVAFVGAYIIRGIRLLVMYNPHMRHRWGRYFNKETFMVKVVIVLFVVLQLVSSLAVVVVGAARETTTGDDNTMLGETFHEALQAMRWLTTLFTELLIRIKFAAYRVAGAMIAVIAVDMLLTIGASLMLVGKLARTKDMFDMSVEIRSVGGFALLALGELMGIVIPMVPATVLNFYLILFLTTRFGTAVWITNIQPVRKVLQRRADHPINAGGIASLFPYVPWTTRSGAVAIDVMNESKVFTKPSSSKFTSVKLDDKLEEILRFPPLLEAFGEFCRKALCSESLMFLTAGKDFHESLDASDADYDTIFARFNEIVDQYIRDGSSFEVNIESKTKAQILSRTSMSSFKELPLDDAVCILDLAVKEIGKMLQENLYNKFRSTEQFKEIKDMLYSAEAAG
ncbi:unnamed protein product [Ectocarpus sp. CCAP 1310/34]|nr:unnamed protein product [Ectocarpus sp. CCAP 1310/34]